MENPEEILHCLEEFAKLKPKDIPRELEDYLCFVAKTGDPVYQWSAVKSLFREKLLNVITDFYESCPSIDIPPCPNVDVFNYEVMKNFILEKLDTFAAAPFTVQRICELLTTPRKEYNRIDKYMRALEKNILVVSTTEPGNRRTTENGDGFVNGIENEHAMEMNSNNDINVEEMDDTTWAHVNEAESNSSENTTESKIVEPQISPTPETTPEQFSPEATTTDKSCSSTSSSSSSSSSSSNSTPETDNPKLREDSLFVSIEPVVSNTCSKQADAEPDVTVTITAIPAAVQKRRDSIEPAVSTEGTTEQTTTPKDEPPTNSDTPAASEPEPEPEPEKVTSEPSDIPTKPEETDNGNMQIENAEAPCEVPQETKVEEQAPSEVKISEPVPSPPPAEDVPEVKEVTPEPEAEERPEPEPVTATTEATIATEDDTTQDTDSVIKETACAATPAAEETKEKDIVEEISTEVEEVNEQIPEITADKEEELLTTDETIAQDAPMSEVTEEKVKEAAKCDKVEVMETATVEVASEPMETTTTDAPTPMEVDADDQPTISSAPASDTNTV